MRSVEAVRADPDESTHTRAVEPSHRTRGGIVPVPVATSRAPSTEASRMPDHFPWNEILPGRAP